MAKIITPFVGLGLFLLGFSAMCSASNLKEYAVSAVLICGGVFIMMICAKDNLT